jgi:hypothetical protein
MMVSLMDVVRVFHASDPLGIFEKTLSQYQPTNPASLVICFRLEKLITRKNTCDHNMK